MNDEDVKVERSGVGEKKLRRFLVRVHLRDIDHMCDKDSNDLAESDNNSVAHRWTPVIERFSSAVFGNRLVHASVGIIKRDGLETLVGIICLPYSCTASTLKRHLCPGEYLPCQDTQVTIFGVGLIDSNDDLVMGPLLFGDKPRQGRRTDLEKRTSASDSTDASTIDAVDEKDL